VLPQADAVEGVAVQVGQAEVPLPAGPQEPRGEDFFGVDAAQELAHAEEVRGEPGLGRVGALDDHRSTPHIDTSHVRHRRTTAGGAKVLVRPAVTTVRHDGAMSADPELDHLAELATVQAAFLEGVRRADPTVRVPWCGRWRVRDLVVHLARVHHWAAAQARREREVPLGRGPFDLPQLYEDCARELVETLTTLGPDAISSTLIGRGPASFWRRRQLHETAVHLWDLRHASGEGLSLRAEIWADTVDEVVTVMQPRQVRMGRMAPLTAGIGLVAQ